ncbi:unnamed protein product [Peronospora belbahrii]|uniref:NUC153 domain-containing protein n=1 Tax=Peronospora belbahrii TaxID=622444 RepID=A0AAU9KWZ7_9STRA|nr:unnamed protein product [Peronospora belbahrii]
MTGKGKKRKISMKQGHSSNQMSNNKPKQKAAKKPQHSDRRREQQQQQEEEEDVEIDEEDVAFYEKNAEFTEFLANMDTKALSKPIEFTSDKKRALKSVKLQDGEIKDKKDEDIPLEKLEAHPRKAAWTTDKEEMMKDKLPVKFMDGSVHTNKLLAEEMKVSKDVEANGR